MRRNLRTEDSSPGSATASNSSSEMEKTCLILWNFSPLISSTESSGMPRSGVARLMAVLVASSDSATARRAIRLVWGVTPMRVKALTIWSWQEE